MKPDELLAWRESLGLTQRAAAEALGMSLKSFQELERGAYFDRDQATTIDRRTALACTAIAFDLAPWPTKQRVGRRRT